MNTPRSPEQAGLNPALSRTPETSHDTAQSTPPPIETASVQRQEGRIWPVTWLIVAVIGAVLTVYILLF